MKSLRILTAVNLCLFALLSVALLAGAARSTGHLDRLTLVSPNGQNRIDLYASDSAPGIWISRGGERPSVNLYCSREEGAVVGCRASNRGPLDAAISSSGQGRGVLSLSTGQEDRLPRLFAAEDLR